MEIDKDKVVELSKKYVDKTLSISTMPETENLSEQDKIFLDLVSALCLPPPRPSKEECIEFINWLTVSCSNPLLLGDKVLRAKTKATIEYLKEPSLQWVKNTGVRPEYKVITIRLVNGEICSFYSEEENLRWSFKGSKGDILEYIILE